MDSNSLTDKKYAVIRFEGKECNNLGDQFLVYTSKMLLNLSGIPEEAVIEIDYEDLPNWKSGQGEHVYLPVTFPFLKNAKINQLFSEDIDPIFIGFFWANNELTSDEITYLKKYEPIGCRDEYAYTTMKKNGIKAWLNGCSTIINKFTDLGVESCRHIFLVDIPDEIMKLFPSNIIQDAIITTQMIKKDKLKGETPMFLMKKQYARYASEASRVVTTKLHCAMACLCMNIPVILVQNTKRLPVRMAWIEKLLPVYTKDELSEIDWNFKMKDITKIKQMVTENAVSFMKEPYKYNPLMDEITDYYKNRERKDYFVEGYSSAVDYVDENFMMEKEIRYAFWGITIFTDMINRYIKQNYPNAKLDRVIDKYKNGFYEGVKIERLPSNAECFRGVFLFVTAESAKEEAQIYLKENHLTQYHLIV